MFTEESCRSHGARRKGRVLQFLTQAANSEPAGRLHPCKKSSDAELLFCREGDKPDTDPLISNMVWIWKQTGDGSLQEFCQHCQIKPSWGRFRNVQDCLDLQRVWVLVGISMLGYFFPPARRFWQQWREWSRYLATATDHVFQVHPVGVWQINGLFYLLKCIWFSEEAELSISWKSSMASPLKLRISVYFKKETQCKQLNLLFFFFFLMKNNSIGKRLQ